MALCCKPADIPQMVKKTNGHRNTASIFSLCLLFDQFLSYFSKGTGMSVFKHKNDKLSYDRIIFSYSCRKNAYTDLTLSFKKKVLDIITAIALYSDSLKVNRRGFYWLNHCISFVLNGNVEDFFLKLRFKHYCDPSYLRQVRTGGK